MRQQLRGLVRISALPVSIAAFAGGLWGWSFIWFVVIAALSGIAFADQRLTLNDPLNVRHFIPGPRRNDIMAGVFAFVGSLAGLGVMYLVGAMFA